MRLTPVALLLLAATTALAQQPAPPPRIYSCVAPDGRRLTSDRPIPECLSREQRVLRHDGTQKAVFPPALSPDERAAEELRQRELAVQKAAQADAVRYDRNLLGRYPKQARHDAARQAALDDLQKSAAVSEQRLKTLAKDRKALDEEAEFYKGRRLPAKLRQQLDLNDAAAEAQRQLLAQQDVERTRVNRRYDLELARLKKLWTGAAPGSLGPPPSAKDFEAVAAAAPAVKPPSASSSEAR